MYMWPNLIKLDYGKCISISLEKPLLFPLQIIGQVWTRTWFFQNYQQRYLCLREKAHGYWNLLSDEAPNSNRVLTLGHCIIEDQTRWRTVTKIPGEFSFTNCYWEWLEFVVGQNKRILYDVCLFGVATTSLYTYDHDSDVVQAFCEAWCPLTNTIHGIASELFISLWDLGHLRVFQLKEISTRKTSLPLKSWPPHEIRRNVFRRHVNISFKHIIQ